MAAREASLRRSKMKIVLGWASDFVAMRVPVALKARIEAPICGVEALFGG